MKRSLRARVSLVCHQVVRRTPSYGSDLGSLAEMCLGESVVGAYGSGSANGGYTEEQVQIKPHDGPSTNTRLAIQIIIACGTLVFCLSGGACAFDCMPRACTVIISTRTRMPHGCRYFEQKPACVDQLRSIVSDEVTASMAQPAVATAVVQQCVSYLERLRKSPVGKGIPLLPSKMRLTSVHAPWLEVVTAPPPLIQPRPAVLAAY
eukprot:COSAG01_NODE_1885_length_8988_cov_2.861514_3_plen_206_part_00